MPLQHSAGEALLCEIFQAQVLICLWKSCFVLYKVKINSSVKKVFEVAILCVFTCKINIIL